MNNKAKLTVFDPDKARQALIDNDHEYLYQLSQLIVKNQHQKQNPVFEDCKANLSIM